MALVRSVLLVVAVLSGVAHPAPLAAQAQTPRPAEHFARLPFLEDPELSPSGELLAARISVQGKQFLGIIPLGGGQPRLADAGQVDVNWFSWVNNDWLVAGLGDTTYVEGDDWYITRLLRLSADMKTSKLLMAQGAGQNADDVIWIARDGSPRLLMARQTSIFRDAGFFPEVAEVDVATGQGRTVQKSRPGIWDWYADASGRVRMGRGFTDDGRSRRLIYRGPDEDMFRVIDRADTRKDESLLVPALFLPGGNAALAVNDDEKGFGSLYELELPSLKLGRRVFGVEGYDIGGIVTDGLGTSALGIHVTEKASRIHWLDPDMAEIQAAIDKSIPAPRRATIVSMSQDRARLLIHVGSASEPGRYYVFDLADSRLRPFAYVSEDIRGPLHPVQTISYKARDGLAMSAVLTLPAGKPAKALPLIVMPHGGPWARDKEQWDWWAQFLADRGYAVVQPNYRGSSGFGTPFSEASYGEWGLKMQDDLTDSITHLAGQGIADPKRVCIVGGSYGGYAAMRAAQRDGAHYRCAASFAGVSDLVRLRRYDSSFLGGGVVADRFKREAPDLAKVSPLNFPQDFSIPLLLVHGKKDLRVPVNQSRLLAERLQALGKTVSYVEQREGDHVFSREADRLEFLLALEAFLAKHNPA